MSKAKTALIIGASRGLGLGLVKTLLADGWQVTATVRNPQNAEALQALGNVRIEKLDMDDQQAVIALSQKLKGEVFDLLFVNAGVKGPDVQTPGGATLAEVGQLFFTNAVAPINLAQRFAAQIQPDSGVLAFMSSVLGSVTMPDAPELALYKASKAALNSMTNSFVTQLGEQKLTVLSLHPGWVKTDMGGEGADIDVQTSTRGLVDQVNAYAGKGGHHFVNYKGETIPWSALPLVTGRLSRSRLAYDGICSALLKHRGACIASKRAPAKGTGSPTRSERQRPVGPGLLAKRFCLKLRTSSPRRPWISRQGNH